MRRFIVAVAVALAGSAVPSTVLGARAQQEGSLAQFSSQVQLVEVYATVTDDKGELVTGLRQKDFEVYENNQLQQISAFTAGEFPLSSWPDSRPLPGSRVREFPVVEATACLTHMPNSGRYTSRISMHSPVCCQ